MKKLTFLFLFFIASSAFAKVEVGNLKYSVTDRVFGMGFEYLSGDKTQIQNVLVELNLETGAVTEIKRFDLKSFGGFEINPQGTKALIELATLKNATKAQLIVVDLKTGTAEYLDVY